MKRQRPPMPPLAVRVQVAENQVWMVCRIRYAIEAFVPGTTKPQYLAYLLRHLRFEHPHLDHDPALILRPYNPRIKNVAARYSPHAHEPNALVYREKADHQQKTTGRKPGAERTITTKSSDIGLKAKFNRLEGRTKKRRKVKIPARKNPWPKRGFVK
jgi:hypothetical protein